MTFNKTDELDNQKIAKKKILKIFLSGIQKFLKNLPEKNSPPPSRRAKKCGGKRPKRPFLKVEYLWFIIFSNLKQYENCGKEKKAFFGPFWALLAFCYIKYYYF